MRPNSAPPWIASHSQNGYHGYRTGSGKSLSQQDRAQQVRVHSAITRRHGYKTADTMASSGMLVQSRVGDSVISDRLSTKSAVRGVVASNIREKGRLFYLNRSYDRGTWNSRCDFNHQQTLAKLHMSRLLCRANEEKDRRQIEQEKIDKSIEEREKKKTKSSGKTPFAFGRVKPVVQSKESNMTTLSMDELKEFIDELDDSEDEDQTKTSNAKKAVPKVSTDQVPEKPLSPLKEIDEAGDEEEDLPDLPDLKSQGGAALVTGGTRGSSRSSMASRTSVRSNKPPLKQKASGLQRPGLIKHRTTLTPETVQALAVKLGASDSTEDLDPSASAGRILQVLRDNEGAEEQTDSRFRKLTRLLSRANLVSEAVLSTIPRNTKRSATDMSDKFLEKYYHMSKSLPPVHATEPGGFQDREWENKDGSEADLLTEEEWQDIKWCRYVRFSKKFHNSHEIVALDMNV